MFAVGLVAMVILSAGDRWAGHDAGFSREDGRPASAGARLVSRMTPACFPPLGSSPTPTSSSSKLKKEELGRLNGYGWVDKKAGVAHIPIDRAIDILAKTGLPRVEAKAAEPGGRRATRLDSRETGAEAMMNERSVLAR